MTDSAPKATKAVLIAIYFGALPEYFQLWLDSCGRNRAFTWVLVTDCSMRGYLVPANVEVRNSSLREISETFSKRLGMPLNIQTPYKLCDYRPIYWIVLDVYKFAYDFWGHCDVDVIFGRLDHFLSADLFSKYDRILGLGHLSLMRNCPLAKMAYALPGSVRHWKKIFEDANNFGFDEHNGINKIWERNFLRFYKNEAIVADIDPQFTCFRLTNCWFNENEQIFFLREGGVYQGWFDRRGAWATREFAYIHFQKRAMPIVGERVKGSTFLIGPQGFSGLAHIPNTRDELRLLPGAGRRLTFSERWASLRNWGRQIKRGAYSAWL